MLAMKSQTYDPAALEELQFRVARRADQLAQEMGSNQPLPTHCWLLAEREILGAGLPNPSPASGGVPAQAWSYAE